MKVKAKPIARLVNPGAYPNGQCKGCAGGWKCAWHVAEDAKDDLRKLEVLRQTVAGIAQTRIYRVCASFGLESDEMATREEKAMAMLESNPLLA